MSNSYFQFKQFRIEQAPCAMKVGTDGVLLGAWCTLPPHARVLDIGTGSGLIALMSAQRGAAQVDAVEIEPEAAECARLNASESPWCDRVTVLCDDFLHYAHSTQAQYQLIVSNPPYFETSLLPSDTARQQARHTVSLNYEALIAHSIPLLAPEGRLALVFPADRAASVEAIAAQAGLTLVRQLWVKGNETTPIKRVLCEWSKTPSPLESSTLVVEIARHQYSEEYIALTRHFYLKM